VTAFPLSPLLALINNYGEIRIDAYKLLCVVRRAEPKGGQDIGTWQTILELMATAAVITNSLIICFTAKKSLAEAAPVTKLTYFVVIEHAVLGAKFVLAMIVDDVPEDVQVQLDRQEFLTNKMIKRQQDDDDEVSGQFDHLSGTALTIDDSDDLSDSENPEATV
jgi:anoctamin-10/anoctamin-7